MSKIYSLVVLTTSKLEKKMYVKHEIVSKNACDAAYRRFYHIIVSRKLLIT